MNDKRRATEDDNIIFQGVIRTMKRWLDEGQPVIGPNGAPMRNEDGSFLLRPLNAAEMDKILKFLANVDIGVVAAEGSDLADIINRAKEVGGVALRLADAEIPPLDMEGDDKASVAV